MAETPKTDALVRSVQSLLSEKRAVEAKEKDLVASLNRLLLRMGYQVVPSRSASAPRRRRRRGPGRPPGRAKKTKARRRSRPRKSE